MTLTATESHASRPRLGYRRALDGLRGVAIALVVLSHTFGIPTTGITGVELFFVLSGFLITTLLLEEHERAGRVSLSSFYRRRALRLLPALVALLAAFLVYAVVKSLVNGDSLGRPLYGVVAGLGYFTNITLAVDNASMPNELRHLWSLAIEEQFYIVWPPVLFLILGGRKRLALGVLAAAFLVNVLQQMRLHHHGAPYERINFGTDTRSTSILMGCVIAIMLMTAARGRLESAARRVLPLALACFLSLLLVFPTERLSLFSAWIVLFSLSCACLVVVALDDRSRLARVLSVEPMVFLGKISYSLYLWHVALFWAFGLFAVPELMDLPALVLSFAFAIGSYYIVELPFLRRKKRVRSAKEADRPAQATPALSPAGG